MKAGNLNFLEPSGPVQACNGTDLPFDYYGARWECCQLLKTENQYLVDKSEISGRNSKTRAKLHISVSFSNSVAWN